jgi:carboxypeptidase Q
VRGDSDKEKLFVQIDPQGVFPTPNPTDRVFRIMANGMSPGTAESGVSGPVISVESLDQLRALGEENVRGKIVMLDYRVFTTYGDLSPIRGSGAVEASRLGAVAYLNRAIAPTSSIGGLHTGTVWDFPEGVPKIPTACVTIEDAELLTRLLKRGYSLGGTVNLPCRRYEDRSSRNIIFEIPGSGSRAHEVVLIGGHSGMYCLRDIGVTLYVCLHAAVYASMYTSSYLH